MQVQKVLAAIDLGATAQLVLDAAADLAASSGAELTLLHVWHAPHPYTASSGDELAAAVQQDEGTLRMWKETAERRGVARVTTQFLAGDPGDEVLRMAKDYDVIVVGTHGRTGIRHLLMGSVAEKVVRTAPCPVLVVPMGER